MKPVAVLVLIVVAAALAAGIAYVIRFGFRVAAGERLKHAPTLSPIATSEEFEKNAGKYREAVTGLALLGALVWWFFLRGHVGAPDFTLPAHELIQAYATNEPGAFAKYNGKVAAVSGKIHKTGVAFNSPWVEINSRAFSGVVRCVLSAGEAERLGRLPLYSEIVVRGNVRQFLMGDVILNPCALD